MSCPKEASSITHGYNFIETNLGKRNLAKLTNKQVTKKLQHSQYGPIIQDNLSFIIIFSYRPKLKLYSIIYSFCFQHDDQLKVKYSRIATNLYALWLSRSMGIVLDTSFDLMRAMAQLHKMIHSRDRPKKKKN